MAATMVVFLFCNEKDSVVFVRATSVDEERGIIATLREYVRPGENFLGNTYEQLMALGSGRHELQVIVPQRSSPAESA